MTIEDIKDRIKGIKKFSLDSERAHSMEDGLYIDVLEFIASSECNDPEHFAREALKARKLKFDRWYA